MRIARYSSGDDVAFGLVDGDPADPGSLTVTPISGHPFAPVQLAGRPRPLAEVRLLAPMLPSKVIGIGRNYVEHARELGNEVDEVPVTFLKPSTSVIGPGDPIQYPSLSSNVHYEAELAVVIGRLCREVPIERAHDVIFGYTCANDVTARDLQKSEKQWARAKGFDSFCPLGPWVETDLDPADLGVRCIVNGEKRQDGRTAEMVRNVPYLIAHITAAMTLLPGDVILTGTPAGVGPLAPGDEVTVAVEGVGALSNPVVARD